MDRSKQKAAPCFLSAIVVLAAAIIASSAGLCPAGETNLEPVTFLPHWIPQAQFAGFYMAREKGIYAKYGLDVNILRGGPQAPSLACLASGKVDFASGFLSSAVEMRDKGVPILNLAQLGQHSGLRLIARKSSGIRTPGDLDGKKVSLWRDFSVQPNALFRKHNVKPEIDVQGPYMEMFLRGAVDVASAMSYNEYHLAINSGIDEEDLTVISFEKDGLDFPEDGIYCLESTAKGRADVCARFVRASIEGWEYVLANMDESLVTVMRILKEHHVRTNRAHQRWMLKHICLLMREPGESGPLGILHSNDLERVSFELKQAGIIKAAPGIKDFYVQYLHND